MSIALFAITLRISILYFYMAGSCFLKEQQLFKIFVILTNTECEYFWIAVLISHALHILTIHIYKLH
jgi:hypothetical protein